MPSWFSSERYLILRKAEEFVQVRGDHNWFLHQYTLSREHSNILESVKIALESQDLWHQFLAHLEPHLVQHFED